MATNPLINERFRSRGLLIQKTKWLANWLSLGDIGSGKSTSLATLFEELYRVKFMKRKFKIKLFDIYCAERMEGAYRALKSNFAEYRSKIAKERGYGAIEYPTRLLYPMCEKFLKNKIRKLPAISEVFTIPIESLDTNDFQALIGTDLSTSQTALWNVVKDYLLPTTTDVDLQNILNLAQAGKLKPKRKGERLEKMGTIQTVAILKRGILGKLIRNGLLSSSKCSTCLDLKKEINEYSIFSVLILKYIDKDMWGFLVHYFLNHINSILSEKKGIKPYATFGLIREVADLFARDFESEAKKSITNDIDRIFKQCRTNRFYLALDLQNWFELTRVVQKQTTIIVCHRTSSFAEIQKEILGHSYPGRTPINMYTAEQLAVAPMLDVGEAFVCQKDIKTYLTSIFPPRHRLWDAKLIDSFEDTWRKEKNTWIKVEEKIKGLLDERKISEDYWEDEGKRIYYGREKGKRKKEVKSEEEKEEHDDIINSKMDAPYLPEAVF